MKLSDKTYDIIKTIQRWLPLVATLYVALGAIWNLPLVDQINKTLTAVAAFLAGILEISTATYNKTKSVYDVDIVDALETDDEEEESLG